LYDDPNLAYSNERAPKRKKVRLANASCVGYRWLIGVRISKKGSLYIAVEGTYERNKTARIMNRNARDLALVLRYNPIRPIEKNPHADKKKGKKGESTKNRKKPREPVKRKNKKTNKGINAPIARIGIEKKFFDRSLRTQIKVITTELIVIRRKRIPSLDPARIEKQNRNNPNPINKLLIDCLSIVRC
jgi:hypothetical protein